MNHIHESQDERVLDFVFIAFVGFENILVNNVLYNVDEVGELILGVGH